MQQLLDEESITVIILDEQHQHPVRRAGGTAARPLILKLHPEPARHCRAGLGRLAGADMIAPA